MPVAPQAVNFGTGHTAAMSYAQTPRTSSICCESVVETEHYGWEGNRTSGASHWPCVTDLSGLGSGLKGYEHHTYTHGHGVV